MTEAPLPDLRPPHVRQHHGIVVHVPGPEVHDGHRHRVDEQFHDQADRKPGRDLDTFLHGLFDVPQCWSVRVRNIVVSVKKKSCMLKDNQESLIHKKKRNRRASPRRRERERIIISIFLFKSFYGIVGTGFFENIVQ